MSEAGTLDYISLWKGYDHTYSRYETQFPPAFFWNRVREDVPRYVKGSDGFWYAPGAKASGTALLCCTGDLMCEPAMTRANRYGDSYFFHPCFQYVRHILKSADFTVGNLETTVSDKSAYAGDYHMIGRKYNCNAPESYLDAVRYAGFDALVNANNHNLDAGLMGLKDTLDALDRHSFMHTGAFSPESGERVLLVSVNGIRLGILSYGTRYNDLDNWYLTQEGRDTFLNHFTPEKARADIAEARRAGAEFVICYMHWGKDYLLEPNEQELTFAKDLADAGVDFIVGSHTHCLQTCGTVTASDGHVVPLVYSMGNFVTNESKDISKRTGILQLWLRRVGEKITVQSYFIPCYVCNEMGTGRYTVVPAIPALAGVDNDTLRSARAYIMDNVITGIPEPPTAEQSLSKVCAVMGILPPEGADDLPVTSLCVQPNAVRPGCLYFASGLETPRDWKQIRKAKPIGVVTAQEQPNFPCLMTADVKSAYLACCKAMGSLTRAKRVLVAGTEGKTYIRKLLCHVLQSKYRVLTHNDGHQADTDTWLRIHPSHDFCVQELRPDFPFGIATGVTAARADVCLVTGGLDRDAMDAIAGAMCDGGMLLYSPGCSAPTKTGHIRAVCCQTLGEAAAIMAEITPEEFETAAKDFHYNGAERCSFTLDGLQVILRTACKSEDAMLCALEALKRHPGRRFAVLGAPDGGAITAAIIDRAEEAGVQAIYCCTDQPLEDPRVTDTAAGQALEDALLSALQPGDTVLLAGGRSAGMAYQARRLFGVTDGYIENAW